MTSLQAQIQRWIASAQARAKIGAARLKDPPWRARLVWLHYVLLIAIGIFLISQVRAIGWHGVWRALPDNSWFYILFLLRYLSIPISEALIYNRLWRVDPVRDFPVLLKKSVFNFGIFGLAGEAYFGVWARQKRLADSQAIFVAMKDVNILSAIVSTGATLLFFLWAVLSGQLAQLTQSGAALAVQIAAGIFVSVLVLALVLSFRRAVFHLPKSQLLYVFWVHSGRLILGFALQVAQWSIILPHVPLWIWLLFIGAELLITRIPFLPKQDLVVLSVGLSLLSLVNVPAAAMTAMLLANAALTQIAHLMVFVVAQIFDRGRAEHATPTSAQSGFEPPPT